MCCRVTKLVSFASPLTSRQKKKCQESVLILNPITDSPPYCRCGASHPMTGNHNTLLVNVDGKPGISRRREIIQRNNGRCLK